MRGAARSNSDNNHNEIGIPVDYIAQMVTNHAKDNSSSTWIVDSGATSHIISNDRKQFFSLHPIKRSVEVKVGDAWVCLDGYSTKSQDEVWKRYIFCMMSFMFLQFDQCVESF